MRAPTQNEGDITVPSGSVLNKTEQLYEEESPSLILAESSVAAEQPSVRFSIPRHKMTTEAVSPTSIGYRETQAEGSATQLNASSKFAASINTSGRPLQGERTAHISNTFIVDSPTALPYDEVNNIL